MVISTKDVKMGRFLSAAAGLACAIGMWGLAPAQASAQELQWLGAVSEDGASLTYGVPESDAAFIDFTCDRGSGVVTVTLDHEPVNAEPGVKAEITLSSLGSNPDSAIVVAATGERLELDDKFILQGSIELNDKLRKVLLEAATLVVAVEDGSEEVPLAGGRDAAKKLFAACKR